MYWHGREIGDIGPTDWAYPLSCGSDGWWQALGFDEYDLQINPKPNTVYLHDWLSPMWSGRERSVTLPYWALTTLCAFLPFIAVARAVRRLRSVEGDGADQRPRCKISAV
jgi:hypothetical protein